MGTKQLTQEEVVVLLCVKALNDFKDLECPNDTLDTKINKFDYTSEDGMYKETFIDGLKKLETLGIIHIQLEDEDSYYVLTAKGKVTMKALSAIKGFTDETVQKIVNGTISVLDFTKEHWLDILTILSNLKF